MSANHAMSSFRFIMGASRHSSQYVFIIPFPCKKLKSQSAWMPKDVNENPFINHKIGFSFIYPGVNPRITPQNISTFSISFSVNTPDHNLWWAFWSFFYQFKLNSHQMFPMSKVSYNSRFQAFVIVSKAQKRSKAFK